MTPEELAQKAGFKVPFGNWITPDGTFIISDCSENQHKQTLQTYLNETPPDNPLTWMNQKVQEGFIRIIFQKGVMCQVPGSMEDLWSDNPSFLKLIFILQRLENEEVHVFSTEFYIIGIAKEIAEGRIESCKVRNMNQEIDDGQGNKTQKSIQHSRRDNSYCRK